MTKKPITEPSAAAEREQRDIVNNKKTRIDVRGTTFKIGGIYNDTLDHITDVLQQEKDDKKVTAKCTAYIYLNGYFKNRLLYWAVWRWFYYVKQFTDDEMRDVIAECKKKADSQAQAYLLNIILLTDVRQTSMAMTREEAQHIQAELRGGHRGVQPPQPKEVSSSPTSSKAGTSSSASTK